MATLILLLEEVSLLLAPKARREPATVADFIKHRLPMAMRGTPMRRSKCPVERAESLRFAPSLFTSRRGEVLHVFLGHIAHFDVVLFLQSRGQVLLSDVIVAKQGMKMAKLCFG